jgi:multidrug resistance efflux pump
MNRASGLLPKLSFFLGGAVLGLFLWSRKTEVRSIRAQARADAESVRELRQLLSNLQAGLARQESLSADLLKQLQDRLEELSSRVGETPSTQEIVNAVERLLFRTMTSLDERLSAQAQSIELLKSTISQTDSLLERVLESIDSLEVEGESAVVISQPAIENPPS